MSTKQDTVRLFMQTPGISCLRREQKFYKYCMLLRARRGLRVIIAVLYWGTERSDLIIPTSDIFAENNLVRSVPFSEDSWQ